MEMTIMRALLLSLLLAVPVAVPAAGAEKFLSASATEPAFARYLVTLGDYASVEPVETLAPRLAAQYGVRIEPFARDGFRGFMIVATPARARLLSLDVRVASVAEQAGASQRETPPQPIAVEPPRPLRVQTNAGGTTLTIGPFAYDPAGNISRIGPAGAQESFHYDPLIRVRKATYASEAWQEYDYDRYGNIRKTRTKDQAERTFGVDAATNQIDLPNDPLQDVNAVYDDNGNLKTLQWGVGGVIATLNYDTLNVVTDSTVSNVYRRHLYNASDERLVTIDETGFERWTIRGPDGQVLRRFATSGAALTWTEDYVYRGGAMLASFLPAPYKLLHYHLDHLGSPRLVTGNGGVKLSEHRYYPFGEEFTDPNQDPELKKFTGHERDPGNPGSADDLDYMHARYYGPAAGRFLSIDPIDTARLDLPQSWNLYAYGLNNPLMFVDPTGMYVTTCNGDPACEREAEKFEVARQSQLKSTDKNLRTAAAAYGDPGVENGVSVSFVDATSMGKHDATVTADLVQGESASAKYDVRIKKGMEKDDLKNAVVHEGEHIRSAQAYVSALSNGIYDPTLNLTLYQTEMNAYMVSWAFARTNNSTLRYNGMTIKGAMPLEQLKGEIDKFLRKNYQLTPETRKCQISPCG
jgi:RHS repeat-associated protein